MIKRPLVFVKNFDWILFAAVMLLICFGLIEIYSIALGQNALDLINFKKQILFVTIGLIMFFMFASYNYLNLRNYSTFIYVFGLMLLLGVIFFGEDIRGTRGWFNFGPFNLQPVEFVKIILIIYLARYFSVVSIKLNPLKHLFLSGLGVGTIIFLVMQQPDFGSSMILFGLWFIFLFVTGLKYRYILSIIFLAIIILFSAWFFLFQDYQKERIITFLNPKNSTLDQSYNINQAMIAIGSGQWIGRGVGFGSQSQLKFLPEAQNDFIFAVIAEELGFLGVVIILFLFGLIFYRLLKNAKDASNDYGAYFLLGVLILIFIEMFINIGMNIGIMPVVGISLPFLSYGGSAIISTLILLGMAQSIIIRSKLKY
ncbi:MAG: rod shape-determining protein RodA [Patescibacteria group bacterium]|nr:rod shape-determining protein RodA [Patescibacteria group bacterium]